MPTRCLISHGRLIYDGDQLVGFMMAAFAPEHENSLYHSYLWRLSIASEHQGKGYGRFAVEELGQEAMRRGQYRLTVSYHAGQHGVGVRLGRLLPALGLPPNW